MLSFLKRLDEVGFEKSRRALAALALSFFITMYLLVALSVDSGWAPAFLALAVCYVVAFLAVTADWFWGRWFASGLGWCGTLSLHAVCRSFTDRRSSVTVCRRECPARGSDRPEPVARC